MKHGAKVRFGVDALELALRGPEPPHQLAPGTDEHGVRHVDVDVAPQLDQLCVHVVPQAKASHVPHSGGALKWF